MKNSLIEKILRRGLDAGKAFLNKSHANQLGKLKIMHKKRSCASLEVSEEVWSFELHCKKQVGKFPTLKI